MAPNKIREWSKQQTAIFLYFIEAIGHLIVRARAGTGKTTTIVEAVKRWLAANPNKNAIVCAFNTRIKDELKTRFTGHINVEVQTLHAMGFAACRNYRDNLKVEDPKKVEVTRADRLALEVCGSNAPDAIVRLVSKLHTKGREIAPHATKVGDLTSIAMNFECTPDANWERSGFGLAYVEARALEAMEKAADVKSGDIIDYSDMIFLPCRKGWVSKQADLVVVDEAQDMTTAQLEIAVGSLNDGGRVIVVGDDRQAIYGFRGADSQSLDRLKHELSADELGLTKTYRCGKCIVELAQEIVPDFEYGEDNPEGVISEITMDQIVAAAEAGDFVLSRVNAPLVSTAMKFLRAGKRARVAGLDIGRGLLAVLRKMKARTVPELLNRIETWLAREVLRHEALLSAAANGRRKAIQSKIDNLRDQADMLIAFADGARNVQEVMDRVEHLFSDNLEAGTITLSSVHKAKGLEANRVFILRDTLRTGSIEEDNIRYVAMTRAKNELVWVSEKLEGRDAA